MFYNLFTSILDGIRAFTNEAANYLRCRSMCCNNIRIYNPKSCCVQGEIYNRWAQATTPGAEPPVRRDTTTRFFSPKNK